MTYINPPFSLNVDTDVGKRFLKIVRDFPKNNVLAPIVNTNTIKISYRTLQNMGGEISRHNKKILGGEDDNPKTAFNPSTGICKLCCMEKFLIMFKPEDATLNLSS